MSKGRLFGLVSLVASSFVVWLYIVAMIPPNRQDILLMTTFFVSLIVWLASLFTYALYTYQVNRGNREIIYAHIKPSIRQGLLAAVTIAVLLFLQLLRVVTVWDTILVIFVAFLLEIALRHPPSLERKRL